MTDCTYDDLRAAIGKFETELIYAAQIGSCNDPHAYDHVADVQFARAEAWKMALHWRDRVSVIKDGPEWERGMALIREKLK